MHDRGIDADHQIERLDQSGGIGEIVKFLGPVVQHHAVGRHASLRRRGAFLQRNQGKPRDDGERRVMRQRDGTPPIHRLSTGQPTEWRTSPDQPDLLARQSGETVPPGGDLFRVGTQIPNWCRNGGERGAKRERQTHHRDPTIEMRQRIAVGDDLRDALQARQQPAQRTRNIEHNARDLGEHRNIAAKLERIAESLFGVHEDGFVRRLQGIAAPRTAGKIGLSWGRIWSANAIRSPSSRVRNHPMPDGTRLC